MTTCPICERRACAVPGCPRLARPSYTTCWHHATPRPEPINDGDEEET